MRTKMGGGKVNNRINSGGRLSPMIGTAAIIVAAAIVGIALAWRAPGLELYGRDWLMRWRGAVAPSDEIVIVAIDEASLGRVGRFPWPRTVMAVALDRLAAAGPKAIALDVLYADPTDEAEDRALAEAIARAGNVVAAAQLTEAEGPSVWLQPLPAIEAAAAGVGHVNVATGYDGVARTLALQQADDEGRPRWAMAAETIRVAEGLKPSDLHATSASARIGARWIPANADPPNLLIGTQRDGSRVDLLAASRLLIDYAGPAGAFAAQTVSFGDLIEGRVAAERLRGRIVLVGATAAALGDRLASPFVHEEQADGRRRGELMPGVEVLANALHTMLRARFYRETPDWLVPIIALFVAAAATLLLTFAQGRFEAIKHLAAIASLFIAILSLSYLVFTRELVVPPLAPALLSCMTAVMLALARRSLVISADLDARIAELAEARTGLAASADESWDALETTPAALIARLADADAAAIVETHGAKPRLLAHHGEALRMPAASGNKSYHAPHSSIAQALAESEPASRYFSFDDDRTADFIQRSRALSIQLSRSADGGRSGALLLAYSSAQPPSPEILLLCREIAGACLDRERTETPRISRNWWPRGGEWKARMLAALNRRLLARACFVERALHSVEDGLLVASPDGRIVFANPRAAKIFGLPARLLIGSDLFERIMTAGCGARADESVLQLHSAREILQRLLVERLPVEREIAIGEAPARHYVARLSAVADERAGVMGVVASLSDITRQRQLQQTQNDVMALVTHEMKTPLTAIRGISEVLAKFEVDGPRSREMHLAINEEAKRLTRMIDEYLDITRLESGARPPRFELTSPAQVLDRALLLLDPVAAERGIHLLRRIAPDLPALALDADLISRAVTNLVSNAIKYSSPGAGVIVDARAEAGSLRIKVADRGCGIPAESLPNIFEKFYRVPRLENMEVNGTGLGLALVREIAELHGGRVTVQSKTGAGSVFTLELPLRS